MPRYWPQLTLHCNLFGHSKHCKQCFPDSESDHFIPTIENRTHYGTNRPTTVVAYDTEEALELVSTEMHTLRTAVIQHRLALDILLAEKDITHPLLCLYF